MASRGIPADLSPKTADTGTLGEVLSRPSRRVATKKRAARRPVFALAVGMVVIVAAIAYLAYQGLTNSLVYYITPSELLARGHSAIGQQLLLGGQVRPGSQHWNPHTHLLTFILQDPHAHVRVASHGLPPSMFASGIGVVVQGAYRNRRFAASTLMVKHSSDYVAPKAGHLPKPDNFANK
jgi:cytochrome c-type biogenesis protein CcmE